MSMPNFSAVSQTRAEIEAMLAMTAIDPATMASL
jgi:hypothetical protein